MTDFNQDLEQNPIRYPLVQATVLKVSSRMPKPTPSMLRKTGTLVTVNPGSKFAASAPKGVGRIFAPDPREEGWSWVSFPDGAKNRYRIGMFGVQGGACDLELAEGEKERFATVNYSGQMIEVPIDGLNIEPGDVVKLERETLRAVGVEPAVPTGSIAFVSQIIDKELAVVDVSGGRRTVFAGKFAGKLVPNGRVVLDSALAIVLENYGLEDDSFELDQATGITWDDICGQEAAKALFLDSMERPMRFPKHYKFFGKKPAAGFLLYGPPGCSKTMFAKAVYTSLVKRCEEKGVSPKGGFILVSGPELLDKYVGVPEATIRHIFARAREFYRRTGIMAVIFIDEAEAILAKRDSGISSDVLKTIVPAFLAQMQGVRESGAIVILATNKPESLDSAAIRPGRIDVKIEIKRPTKVAVREIFLKNFKGVAISSTTSAELLAEVGAISVFSPERRIYEIKKADGTTVDFTLAHIVSGSMIPAIVADAKRLALERELLKPEPTEGLTDADLVGAVDNIARQEFGMDHGDALREFTHDFMDQIANVQKLHQIGV
ncbi:MAG: AAA family ATPase [Candidatus Paceibacterota bacterium]